MATHTITDRRMADWADVKSFLHQYPRVRVIEDGRIQSHQRTSVMLAAIASMESGETIRNGWRPWRVGTCGNQTAVSVVDWWARTRWLLPA